MPRPQTGALVTVIRPYQHNCVKSGCEKWASLPPGLAAGGLGISQVFVACKSEMPLSVSIARSMQICALALLG